MDTQTLRNYWDQRHSGSTPWGTGREPVKIIIELIAKYRHQMGKKGIDFGCGPGRFLVRLAQMGFQMTGIDISQAAIYSARQNLETIDRSAHLFCSSYEQVLTLLPESFDFGIAIQSLQFGSWKTIVKNWRILSDLIRPEGILIIRVRSTERVLKLDEFPYDDSDEYEHQNNLFRPDLRGVTYRKTPDILCHNYSTAELIYLIAANYLELIEGPYDIKTIGADYTIERGQWNMVMTKR